MHHILSAVTKNVVNMSFVEAVRLNVIIYIEEIIIFLIAGRETGSMKENKNDKI